MSGGPQPRSLVELEHQFRRDCALLQAPPAKAWLPERHDPELGPVYDVAIVGAGMAGLACAFALKRLGITNIVLYDRSPEGLEGPWVTYARMQLLRSPPELAGPAVGLASLTFRAWFEAQFGREAWAGLYRIPRPQWMDYLRWYRCMIDVPIANETEMTGLKGRGDFVELALNSPAGTARVAARRVILANGRDGLGGAFVPALFRDLDRRVWHHSSDAIDFAALAGKTIGVIGAGASAADNAAEALEHGAARVAMLVRRQDVPRINKGMGIGSPGMWYGFQRLPLAERWSIVQYIADQGIPPPSASLRRCSRHANFSIFTQCATHAARVAGDKVILETSRGTLAFDLLILATGFAVDWNRRPELASLRPHILFWRDRFAPPAGQVFEQAEDPFLGADLEFQQCAPGTAPWVERVHCCSFPAFLSHGPITGDIPAISVGAERIAQGIAGRLFAEEYAYSFARMQAWANAELAGDEYTVSDDVSPFLARGDEQ